MQTAQLLPSREIPVYDGNPLQFNSFIKAFEHCVESKTSNKGDCLYYLEQYTRGQPRDLVRSCLHLTADRGYVLARKLLKEHFGNEHKVTAAYMDKVSDWPSIKAEDAAALKRYGLFLRECCNAMEELLYLEELNMPNNLRMLIQKLPYKLREKWRVKANEILERTSQRARFLDVVTFIERQIRITADPIFGDIQDVTPAKNISKVERSLIKPQFKRSSFVTNVSVKGECPQNVYQPKALSQSEAVCVFCTQSGHNLEKCRKFEKRSHKEKLDFLKNKGQCFGCFNVGHLSKSCEKHNTCKYCNHAHHSMLHIGQKERNSKVSSAKAPNQGNEQQFESYSTCGHTGAGYQHGILPIVPVKVKSLKGATIVETYAFLDPGSTDTFCTENLLHLLNMQGQKTQIHLRTMGQSKIIKSSVVKGLEISDFSGEHFYTLPTAFTQKTMPVSIDNLISEEELAKWSYLKGLKFPKVHAGVDLLIGTNASKLIEPWEVINSQGEGPYAIRSLLGWVVNGSAKDVYRGTSQYPLVQVNRTSVYKLEQLLISQYNHDFVEESCIEQEEMSREKKRFLDIMKCSAQVERSQYKLPLPFKKENIHMTNNINVALQRLLGLKRKLKANKSFHADYTSFMAETIVNGHAEKVPQNQLQPIAGRVWYIPHHAVYHPQKQKLRIVFDCGAEYKGISLNNQLLQGPNLTSSLVGVLVRFRQEPVALMADIKAMFHQVKAAEEHTDFLRYLWWPDCDLEQIPEEYRMTVHLFGAVSSPSCACYALRRTAEDNETNYAPDVVESVHRNFYMDDLLKSVPTEQDAVTMAKDLTSICSKGGFTLTQWTSNKRNVLQNIAESCRAQTLCDLDLDKDNLPVSRALGLLWCVETDNFIFKPKVKEKPATKRGMLSVISSVYDPLGFLAPVILPAKLLLQKLCTVD
nr:uncharacterized protein LOC129160669 [Nothobranchius furzeri]